VRLIPSNANFKANIQVKYELLYRSEVKIATLREWKFFKSQQQMPRKLSDQEMEEECKKKRIAPNGFRLPDPIRDGEVLTDVKDKKWRIGKSVGLGGFGEIYLGSHSHILFCLVVNTFLA
jgi:hypothetical protein